MPRLSSLRTLAARRSNVVRQPSKALENSNASGSSSKYQTHGIKLTEPVVTKPKKNTLTESKKISPSVTAKPNNFQLKSKDKPFKYPPEPTPSKFDKLSSSNAPQAKPDKDSTGKTGGSPPKKKEKGKKKKKGEDDDSVLPRMEYHEMEILRYSLEALEADPTVDRRSKGRLAKMLIDTWVPRKPLPVKERKKLRKRKVNEKRARANLQKKNELSKK